MNFPNASIVFRDYAKGVKIRFLVWAERGDKIDTKIINKIKEPAKITRADIGFEDHGIFTAFVTFDYGGASQGIGHAIDLEFIKRLIRACGVTCLSECVGRIVMVEHSHHRIHRVEPMPFDRERGKPFDLDKWMSTWGDRV